MGCMNAKSGDAPKQGSAASSGGAAAASAAKDSNTGKGETRGSMIEHKQGSVHDDYDDDSAKSKLGQGSYGTVTKVTKKNGGPQRACKTIRKAQVKNYDRFKQEIEIMKLMSHPNIIKLFETYEDHRNIYLIMELCTGGELFDRIIEMSNPNRGGFTEKEAAIVMQSILRGIYYMHQNGVMHRDLKPENFLLQTKDPIDKATLKIIDFGLSMKFTKGQMMSTKAGTPYYVAPQVLQGKYDHMCDLWSCGVIMYILLCGYPPFHGDTDADVLAKVRLGSFSFAAQDWKGISEDAKQLVRQLLKMNPRERATAEQALNHVWIKEKAPQAGGGMVSESIVSNLKKFRRSNRLRKVALAYIVNQVPDTEVANLRDLFIKLDVDNNGKLSQAELSQAMQSSGFELSPEMLDLLREMDADNSGQIEYHEFLASVVEGKTYLKEDTVWLAFRHFDKDGSGKISKNELKAVLGSDDVTQVLDPNSIDQIMKDVDTDGDGEISFQEFKDMLSGNSALQEVITAGGGRG